MTSTLAGRPIVSYRYPFTVGRRNLLLIMLAPLKVLVPTSFGIFGLPTVTFGLLGHIAITSRRD